MAIDGNTSLSEQHVRIRLNHDIISTITAVQGDTGREFYFVFDDFDIADDYDELRVYVQKPSGREIYHYCYLANGEVVVQPTMQMLAEVGQNKGQIQIIKNHVAITSYPFYLEVERNLIYSISITSMDEYLILDDLINTCRIEIHEIQTLNDTLRLQENERMISENNRKDAEAIRNHAETAREEAEKKRKEDTANMIQNCTNAVNEFIEAGQQCIDNTIESCTNSINEVIDDCETSISNAENATTQCINTTTQATEVINTCNTVINSCEDATNAANQAAELCQSVVDQTGVVLKTEKGTSNGVATLDENTKIPLSQMPYQIYVGTEPPSNSFGNNGDIYLMIIND